MVKQCNIYGQSVQLINYGQVWFQKYYYAYEHLYGILILTPNLQVVYTKSIILLFIPNIAIAQEGSSSYSKVELYQS